jgi:predicted ABC-type ATPase
MAVKRMRVFAGPNGSGKTTIFKGILNENKVNLGVYINADEIELTLSKTKLLNFSSFSINVSKLEIIDFFKDSTFAPVKRNEPDLYKKLEVSNNVLYTNTSIDSYLAADIAEFIRQKLLNEGVSFTYETVMSHAQKIDFFKKAQNKGYKVYLYFIATEDPEINIRRVDIRVAQSGHDVHPEVIKKRYFKSLHNLKEAVKQSNRAYIFDNSNEKAHLVAEITNGSNVVINTAIQTPNWVAEYLS